VLNWNGWRNTVECVESLARVQEPALGLLIVDNGSTDDSREALAQRLPQVPLISTGENLGYAGGNNVGIRYWLDRGVENVGLINNDVVVRSDFAAPLVAALETDRRLGLVAPLILRREVPNRVQCAELDVGIPLGLTRMSGYGETDAGQYDGVRIVEFLMGACLLVRRTVFERVGLLDESFFMYTEEIEFARRVSRAGFRAAVVGHSKVWHRGRAASRQEPGLFLYYGTRNDILVRRAIATWPQWLVFAALDLLVRLPRRLFGLRGDRRLRGLYLRAVRDGYAGRGGRVELSPATERTGG
jgi:GT2 family glycosyltransferase